MTNKIPVAIIDNGVVVNAVIIDEKNMADNMVPLSEIDNYRVDYNVSLNVNNIDNDTAAALESLLSEILKDATT